MWHRRSCQLKAFLKRKEGLLQLGCAMTLQEGCSKDRLHSCWKQDVLDTAHQVCLHHMTGNLLVSPCISETCLFNIVWEVTTDHLLEDTAVFACSSDMLILHVRFVQAHVMFVNGILDPYCVIHMQSTVGLEGTSSRSKDWRGNSDDTLRGR